MFFDKESVMKNYLLILLLLLITACSSNEKNNEFDDLMERAKAKDAENAAKSNLNSSQQQENEKNNAVESQQPQMKSQSQKTTEQNSSNSVKSFEKQQEQIAKINAEIERKKQEEQQLLSMEAINGSEDISSRTIKIGMPLIIENVKFIPINIELKKVKGTKKSWGKTTEIETTEKMLVLNCIVQNVSEGQIFAPITKDTLKVSHIVDNYQNRLSSFAEGAFEIEEYKFEGRNLDKLKPGQHIRTTVMSSKSEIENATEFTWTIYLITNNRMNFNYFLPPKEKAVFLKFSKSEITEK